MALTQIKTTGIADNAVTDAKVADNITASSYLPLAGGTLTGDLTIPQKIVHSGDTDTYLSFGTDSLSLYTGGTNVADFIYGNIYIKGNNKALTGYTTGGGAKELIKIDSSDVVQIGEGLNTTFAGQVNFGTTASFIKQSRFGYSSSYKVLQLGLATSTSAISLGADITGNSSGGFTGNEIVIPNARGILAPNGANDAYLGVLGVTSANTIEIGRGNHSIVTEGNGAISINTSNNHATFAGVGNFTRDASGFNTYIFNDNGAGEGLHIKVKGNDSGQTGRYLIKAEGYGSSGAFTNNFLVDTDGNTTIAGNITTTGSSITVDPPSGDAALLLSHSSQTLRIDQNSIRTTTNSALNLFTNNNNSNGIYINTSGSVGMGTTSINANARLHIRQASSGQTSSSNNTQLTIENSGTAGIQLLTGTSNVGGIWVGDSNGSENGGKLYYSNSDDSWQFYNQGSNNGLTITANGLVQCKRGFTNGQALDIEGETFGRTNSGNIALGYRQDGNGDLLVLQQSSNNVFTLDGEGRTYLYAYSNARTSLNVIASGSGNAPNDAKVYVEKNSSNDWSFMALAGADDYGYKAKGVGSYAIAVENQSSNAYVFRVEYDGDILSANTSIASISDRRLKKEITSASSQWDDIKALNFVNYKWKKSTGMDDSIKYLGLVADEVESVSPSLVKIDAQSKEDIEAGVKDPEYKTVKYSIVWMKAVKALQEAMERIEKLENA